MGRGLRVDPLGVQLTAEWQKCLLATMVLKQEVISLGMWDPFV